VLLKDVLDNSLEGIVNLVGSTVGDVKATLKRRLTTRERPQMQERVQPATPELSRLLRLYSSDSIDTTGMTFEK
jgi:hypothetical protein